MYLFPDKDSITSVFSEYKPSFDNLYTLSLFPLSSSDKASEDFSKYFTFHSPSISFNGESLALKRNEVTKRFQFEDKPYHRTDDISISLREDEEWKVKKYHEKWINSFYDRETDSYRSADVLSKEYLKRYRILRIYFPKEKSQIMTLLILPTNTGNINLGWGSGKAIVHNLTYNVENWRWEDYK